MMFRRHTIVQNLILTSLINKGIFDAAVDENKACAWTKSHCLKSVLKVSSYKTSETFHYLLTHVLTQFTQISFYFIDYVVTLHVVLKARGIYIENIGMYEPRQRKCRDGMSSW